MRAGRGGKSPTSDRDALLITFIWLRQALSWEALATTVYDIQASGAQKLVFRVLKIIKDPLYQWQVRKVSLHISS